MSDPATLSTDGEAFLSKVMDVLVDAICVVGDDGRFVFVSAACRRIFGYEPQEMVGHRMIEFVHPDDRQRTLDQVDRIVIGGHTPHFENRYVRKDGQTVHISWSARWSESGRVRVAVARDVTERKQAESMQAALYAVSEAAHSAEDMLALFRRIHEIVGGLLPAENFFVALYDKQQDELSFPYYVDASHEPPESRPLDSGTLSAEVIRSGEPLLLRGDTKAQLPQRVKLDKGKDSLDWLGVPLHTQHGAIGVLVVQSYSGDVRYTEKDAELLQFVSNQVAMAIERKQMEERLRHIAWHDALTGLPNRALLHDRMEAAVGAALRDGGCLSVLYLDLDTFKQVNDGFGHAVGDLLLQETAVRLRQCVGSYGMVGRIGGDEFLVVLDHIPEAACALRMAEKIRAVLGREFELAGHAVRISPSIGVASFPEHGADYKQLIRFADEAMYTAKKAGGNRSQVTTGSGHPGSTLRVPSARSEVGAPD